MRLFLLPISTRRSLLYCERVQHQLAPGQTPPLADRIITRASDTWAKWERAEKGWQYQITNYGNRLFRRIPFEEWGLKTIPPASKARLADLDAGRLKLQCVFPKGFVNGAEVPGILNQLATERQGLHRKRLYWSIFFMPITLPFAAVPVIPNLPFFYLCFRAYSHYRALYGGKLLEHVTSNNLITMQESAELDEFYKAGPEPQTQTASSNAVTDKTKSTAKPEPIGDSEEIILLQRHSGKQIAEAFHLPGMIVEIERAVEQVSAAVKKDNDRSIKDTGTKSE